MDKYHDLRLLSSECSNRFYAVLIPWTGDQGDLSLKERCLRAAFEYRNALTAELDYLATCSPDPEVLQRITHLKQLQKSTTRDFRQLAEA